MLAIYCSSYNELDKGVDCIDRMKVNNICTNKITCNLLRNKRVVVDISHELFWADIFGVKNKT